MTSIALHVGLNAVDPEHYAGWEGTLAGCENDAHDMAAITRAQGFTSEVVLTREARADRILDFLDRAATSLRTGDRLILTFSGHGGQVQAADLGEPDGLDETWALYDRMVIDNEVRSGLERLPAGVSAVVVLDCCHSGTAIRAALARDRGRRGGVRGVPAAIAKAAVADHRSIYRAAFGAAAHARARAASGGGAAILLAACQDDQVAADGDDNGLFTGALKRIWDGGRFVGDYRAFHRAITERMPREQTPNLDSFGSSVDQFLQERPFSISGSTNNNQETNMTTANDINGNWDEVATELNKRMAGTRGEGSFLTRVIASNAQAAQVAFFGVAAPVATPESRAAVRGGTVARAFWWGFHIEISQDDLLNFLAAADPINAVIGAIGGGIPTPASPFIALAAAFVAGALGLLRGLNRGRGVYVSMSWFAPGVFIPTPVV